MRVNAMSAVAAALFALAAAGLGGAGWLYWRALPALSEIMSGGEGSAAQSCAGAASALGFEVERYPDGSITARLPSMDHPALAFGRASALIASCRGYRLAAFCAGPGCGARRMEVRLAPVTGE